MPTKYYPQKKKRLQKKHVKNIKISLKKNKTKGDKRSAKDIKIFLKKKKSINIIMNVIKVFLRNKTKAS